MSKKEQEVVEIELKNKSQPVKIDEIELDFSNDLNSHGGHNLENNSM